MPLLYFGKYGFGAVPIVWSLKDLNWFYNLVMPGIVVGTLGLLIHAKELELDKARLAVLIFFTTCGLLMMAKFINMSLIGLWQMNSLGFFIVTMWWCNNAIQQYKSKTWRLPLLDCTVRTSLPLWILVTSGALYLVSFGQDSRNPMTLALRSWLDYPSLASIVFSKETICNKSNCLQGNPSPADIALIKSKTKEGEQVAIIDFYDWLYLIGAHRPPLLLFLPSTTIFTQYQLSESLRKIQLSPYLFLAKGDNGVFNFSHDDLKDGLSASFNKDYIYDGEGERLVAWRRVNLIKSKL